MADTQKDGINLTRRQAVAALAASVIVAGGAVALTAAEVANRANGDGEQQLHDIQTRLAEANQVQDAMDKQIAEAGKKQAETEKLLAETRQLQLEAETRLAEANNKQTERENQLAAAHLQIEMYKGLVGLYDTLDRIGIDSIVGTAIAAYKGTLVGLEGGVKALRQGIVRAETALDNFDTTFVTIRDALTAAESAWANVGALLRNAQEQLKNTGAPLIPFVNQAQKFFDDLLGKIPFGVGEGARQTINGIVGLVVAVPPALDSMQDGLFRTLRESWFSDDNARNLQATLVKPIADGALEPARKLLDSLDTTFNQWQIQVAQPVNAALSQREIVQQQIDAYKKQNNIA